ncbi:hypothetical protein K439DRAFT_1136782 [Ramaria rubella]|nr:hypothetical protein K439DRAFT_1136782 [Ramaria rubella]
MSFSFILVAVGALSFASAVSLADRNPVLGRGLITARQSSSTDNLPTPPPQCDSTCQPLAGDFDLCTTLTPACICTADYRNDIISCFNCMVNASPSEFDQLQQIASGAMSECASDGISLGTITLSGGNKKNAGTTLRAPILLLVELAVGIIYSWVL